MRRRHVVAGLAAWGAGISRAVAAGTGWAPDGATRRLILVDNPAELFGF